MESDDLTSAITTLVMQIDKVVNKDQSKLLKTQSAPRFPTPSLPKKLLTRHSYAGLFNNSQKEKYKQSAETRERITITNLSFESLSQKTDTPDPTENQQKDNTGDMKYSRLSRSISLISDHKSKMYRTNSCKSKKESSSSLPVEDPSVNLRQRSKTTDASTQTRFSLNSQLIREIDKMIEEQHEELVYSDDHDNYPDPDLLIDEDEPHSDEDWSDSEEENEDEPDELPENPDNYNEEEDSHYRLGFQSDICPEPDSNIQSVLPSLQSRRGAVHTAVNIPDPKEKFKMPFFSKRKSDRRWSKSELSSVLSETCNDRAHPLSDLMMSHWSVLMADRPQINSAEYKHRDALWGLFRAELVYLIDQLKIIKDVFQGTLKLAKDNGMLSDIDESLLFPNVNKLYKVSNAFSLDLYRMFKEGQASDESVVYALQEFTKKFHQPYQRYCLNYTRAAKYLKKLKKERSDFREYEKLCMEDGRCKKRALSDLLICPMQHLMRYVILLRDIQKHVPENGRNDLRDSIETIQESLRSLESKLGTLQNFQRLQELDNILLWPKIDSMDKSIVIPEELRGVIAEDQSTLCSDGRHILHAGSLHLLENPKSTETYCFLFDDMLLITRTNSTIRKRYNHKSDPLVLSSGLDGPGLLGDAFDTSGGLYDPDQRYIVYKQPLPLDEIRVHDIASSPGGCKHCFAVTTHNRLKCCTGLFTFNALSAENKRVWMDKLRKSSDDFLASHPATPVQRRPRYDSCTSTLIHNGDSISVHSGGSSNNGNVVEVPANNNLAGGKAIKKSSQSFKASSILHHKVPKRCRSAT